LEAGNYTIQLIVTSPQGCVDSATFVNYLAVYPQPVANFNYSPNPVTMFSTQVQLNNYSTGGSTYEWFNSEVRPQIFNNYNITQLLTSVSIKNVIRGIHFSKRSNPQFKIVKCVAGKILDVVIDLRMESPTFGKIDTFELDSKDSQSILISDGFGHGFQVLSGAR
jgi:dTDP-4-dehydrorhamnose 3,5-epimerase